MEQESQSLIVKLSIYIVGVTLGLAAKLAVMYNEKPLTWTAAIAHSLTAFACAWIVWYAMDYYHAQDWVKNGVAVIVGRFGDYILLAIWKAIKNSINSKEKNII